MIMNDEWQVQNQLNKKKWFLGNQEAIDFVNGIFYCVEFWDDLIDKDNEITDARVNECMEWLFIKLPANDFFIRNRQSLIPVMKVAINAFYDANSMANNKHKHIRNLAFHIRNYSTEVIIMTALLCGGEAHLREVSEEIRGWYAFEKFKD
jgi:hypothetical protein